LILGLVFYGMFLYAGHYYVEGVGYAAIEDVLWNSLTDPWFLLILLLAKLLATSLTIGSGGSGGVFSPLLFLGAVSGAFFGNIVSLVFPGLDINPIVFVIAGMAAMVSGAASAPLTAAVIVYEMTLDYAVILPIMAAVSVSFSVRRYFSAGDIYTLKLNRRGLQIPEGLTTDLKSYICIENVLEGDFVFLSDGDVIESNRGMACIVEEGKVKGVIDLRKYSSMDIYTLSDTMEAPIIIHSGMTVAEVVQLFRQSQAEAAIVSRTGGTEQESVMGIVTPVQLIRAIGTTSKLLRW